jgi:threonine/homoserine/homoserine lactone efflux protein
LNISLISAAIVSHALAVVSPGPDFVMAVKNTLTYSRKIGIYTAIGFGVGIGVHILYSFFGISYLIQQHIWVFNTIKYLGAFYLVFIGLQSITSKSQSIQIVASKEKQRITGFQGFKMGFLTNVLNPKASLFFLSLFTFILKGSPDKTTLVVISFFLIVNTALWFIIVAIFFDQALIRKSYEKYQNVIQLVLGILLIGLGISIIFW